MAVKERRVKKEKKEKERKAKSQRKVITSLVTPQNTHPTALPLKNPFRVMSPNQSALLIPNANLPAVQLTPTASQSQLVMNPPTTLAHHLLLAVNAEGDPEFTNTITTSAKKSPLLSH